MSSREEQKKYVSASEAAARVGYTGDYVTKLAREGKITAVREGRKWLVDLDSLKLFTLQIEADKRARAEALREERLTERYQVLRQAHEDSLTFKVEAGSRFALLETLAVVASLFVAVHIVWFSFESNLDTAALAAGAETVGAQLSAAVIEPLPEFFAQIKSSATSEQERRTAAYPDTRTRANAATSEDPNFGGVIFVSETENNNRAAAIRETFSDEVEVNFEPDGTGVITPVFREQEGESYRLRLIPIEDGELRVME